MKYHRFESAEYRKGRKRADSEETPVFKLAKRAAEGHGEARRARGRWYVPPAGETRSWGKFEGSASILREGMNCP